MSRTAAELVQVEDPAWPSIVESIMQAPIPVRVLPVAPGAGERTIESLQVTARSVLGALAMECGALLVDHGWLRMLGGGAEGLPDLATVNGLAGGGSAPGGESPDSLIVAWDVLGGRFAIDGGGLGIAAGQVCYFAPDSLRWEGLDLGHGEFVHAMIGGAGAGFYDSLRWPGWEQECAALRVTEGFSLHPPPFSEEGKDLAAVSRQAVPLVELFGFYDDAARAQRVHSGAGRQLPPVLRLDPCRWFCRAWV